MAVDTHIRTPQSALMTTKLGAAFRAATIVLVLGAVPAMAQNQNDQGQNNNDQGKPRSAPEFDPAVAGAIAAIVAGGGVLLARRRRR
jgi:hypothetical protein